MLFFCSLGKLNYFLEMKILFFILLLLVRMDVLVMNIGRFIFLFNNENCVLLYIVFFLLV